MRSRLISIVVLFLLTPSAVRANVGSPSFPGNLLDLQPYQMINIGIALLVAAFVLGGVMTIVLVDRSSPREFEAGQVVEDDVPAEEVQPEAGE